MVDVLVSVVPEEDFHMEDVCKEDSRTCEVGNGEDIRSEARPTCEDSETKAGHTLEDAKTKGSVSVPLVVKTPRVQRGIFFVVDGPDANLNVRVTQEIRVFLTSKNVDHSVYFHPRYTPETGPNMSELLETMWTDLEDPSRKVVVCCGWIINEFAMAINENAEWPYDLVDASKFPKPCVTFLTSTSVFLGDPRFLSIGGPEHAYYRLMAERLSPGFEHKKYLLDYATSQYPDDDIMRSHGTNPPLYDLIKRVFLGGCTTASCLFKNPEEFGKDSKWIVSLIKAYLVHEKIIPGHDDRKKNREE